ncbi:MAG: UbiA family prenyltransferase [Bacteroidota bacterium]
MQDIKNTLKLLRIPFSVLLMPLFLFALSQSQNMNVAYAIISFLIIHLLVYPASNGYNSYIDKDTESIGGIEHPPQPTKTLFYTTVCLDVLAICLATILINYLFAMCLLIYILASKAYSSTWIRLKKYPVAGFLTVVIFQGGFTYYMSSVGITGDPIILNQNALFILLACSFQIAGAYPLTQIYQHEQDKKEGVITLSYKLGYTGTFLFTMTMFVLCNVFYFLYFNNINKVSNFYIIQLFFLPIVMYFGYWFYKVWKDKNNANFKYTMGMNRIAAICMNTCFIVLFICNRYQ